MVSASQVRMVWASVDPNLGPCKDRTLLRSLTAVRILSLEKVRREVKVKDFLKVILKVILKASSRKVKVNKGIFSVPGL